MRPNNEFTTPDQRFFLPINNEIEHHETFDVSNVPRVEILDGENAYAVIHTPEGRELGCYAGDNYNIQSGSKIKTVATVDPTVPHGDYAYYIDRSEPNDLDDPVTLYEPREGDVLIVQADLSGTEWDHRLPDELADKRGVMFLPAGETVPYTNGTAEGEADESTRFRLLGIITPEQKLIAWQSAYGAGIRWIVDLCVVNASVRNRTELSLLADNFDIGGSRSLIGTLSMRDAARAYLEHFDSQQGTHYVPTKEPRNRFDEFPETFTAAERERYDFIFSAMHAAGHTRR